MSSDKHAMVSSGRRAAATWLALQAYSYQPAPDQFSLLLYKGLFAYYFCAVIGGMSLCAILSPSA